MRPHDSIDRRSVVSIASVFIALHPNHPPVTTPCCAGGQTGVISSYFNSPTARRVLSYTSLTSGKRKRRAIIPSGPHLGRKDLPPKRRSRLEKGKESGKGCGSPLGAIVKP